MDFHHCPGLADSRNRWILRRTETLMTTCIRVEPTTEFEVGKEYASERFPKRSYIFLGEDDWFSVPFRRLFKAYSSDPETCVHPENFVRV